MKISALFDYIEIETPYMEKIIQEVVCIIGKSIDYEELNFGPVIEGQTHSGEAGEVTEDGNIILDSSKLAIYEYDISMAIIAHEFAHYHCGHYRNYVEEDGLRKEDEADSLAQNWGFNIKKFREVCGVATIS